MHVFREIVRGEFAVLPARRDHRHFARKRDEPFKDRVLSAHGLISGRDIAGGLDAGLALAIIAEAAGFQDGGHADLRQRGVEIGA